MALKANAVMKLDHYKVGDDGIHLFFFCADPGPGEENEWMILITDADLAGVTTNPQLRQLVLDKFARKIRGQNIATKLDAFIGQNVTVP